MSTNNENNSSKNHSKNNSVSINESTLIALIVICCALVIALICAIVFFVTNNNNNENSNLNATITTTVANMAESTVTQITTEEQITQIQNTTVDSEQGSSSESTTKYFGKWQAKKAVNIQTGEEESLRKIYGSAFSQYGGTLTINENGTFSLWIGVSASEDDHIGTYTFNSENNIDVTYQNGQSDTFKIEDSEGVVTIIAKQGEYNIYFQR